MRLLSVWLILVLNWSCYAKLQVSPVTKFLWPQGSMRLQIDDKLEVYRDWRSYDQLLLIHNYSEHDILLHGNQSDEDANWLLPAGQITALVVKQESMVLRCIEQSSGGEATVSCYDCIQAGLLEDTTYRPLSGRWLGNFADIYNFAMALNTLGLQIII